MKVIELQEVWKKYWVHFEKRIFIKEVFSKLLRRSKYYDEFWALKDISLEIKKGETLGIIGENGAGKTTLLKLLCGVTKVTRGSIKVNGRVAGLLELGTGFQGDLSGRENIYLNGLILGLSRKDIQRNIDSIIDFADIGDFIDAPVRTYSAGMYVRLGFAIAANVDSDILLIDEVLAVGDVGFQRKCLEKIKEFKRNGKTIVFVSHELQMVYRLCDRIISLNRGSIVEFDEKKVIPTGKILIQKVYFKNGRGDILNIFEVNKKMIVSIEYEAFDKTLNLVFGIGIYDREGNYLVASDTRGANLPILFVEGKGKIEFEIKSLPFKVGTYDVSVSAHDQEETQFYDYHNKLYQFSIVDSEKKIKYGLIGIDGVWSHHS